MKDDKEKAAKLFGKRLNYRFFYEKLYSFYKSNRQDFSRKQLIEMIERIKKEARSADKTEYDDTVCKFWFG